MTVEELMSKASDEQIAKVQVCKTKEEILAAAQEENFALTGEEAEEILKVLYPPYGEISDDSLDMVAGGKGDEPECKHDGAATLLASTCRWTPAFLPPNGLPLRKQSRKRACVSNNRHNQIHPGCHCLKEKRPGHETTSRPSSQSSCLQNLSAHTTALSD